jgi:hypothetical protein
VRRWPIRYNAAMPVALTRLARVPAPAWIVLLAVALALMLGPGSAGYDASWSLVWGGQIADGQMPDYEANAAPTPHPLSNLVAAVLSPAGWKVAATGLVAIEWLSLAALGWATAQLGGRLFGMWAGVLAAVVLVSRQLIVVETGQAILDIPFLALVVWAAAHEVRHPRAGVTVPALLALAGLLRPEGWLVAGAYLVYRVAAGDRERLPLLVAITAAAPALWLLGDLLVTGDPLHSLHGTQDLAAQLDRPRDTDTALAAAPTYLRFALQEPAVWVGFAGAAAGLLGFYERSLLPGAIIVIGLGAFLALGVAGLPLLVRYLLLPSAMLAVFCGLAALGWAAVPRRDPTHRRWVLVGALAAVVLAAGVPSDARRVADGRRGNGDYHRVYASAQAILDAPAVQNAARRCRGVSVPDFRPLALAALALDRDPDTVTLGPGQGASLALAYANPDAAEVFAIGPPPEAGTAGLTGAGRTVASNRDWIAVAVRC